MTVELLVNIDVDDLERALEFYTRAFDFTPARRFGTSGVELVGGSSPIYLLAKDAGTPPFPGGSATRDYARHWTPVHIDIVVDNIDAGVARAVAAGARLEGEIARNVWGNLALLSDPFGNGLCLLEFENRGYDEITTTVQ
jgi:predicted enzyme related to lactoylglutathione lyase